MRFMAAVNCTKLVAL